MPTIPDRLTPERRGDALLVAKATLATVGAWLVSEQVLHLEQAFLAAWAAVLTVHATVSRSLVRGLQTIAATLLGILVATLLVRTLGSGAVALGAGTLLGLAISRWRPLRLEGVAAATTALFVITGTRPEDESQLLSRFVATLVGVGIAVVVNLVVVPPVDDGIAGRDLRDIRHRTGDLLRRIADELGGEDPDSNSWIEATRDLDRRLDAARGLVDYTAESQRWNPRRRSPRAGDATAYAAMTVQLEEALSHVRTLARTVDRSIVDAQAWDPRFREEWLEVLRDAGGRLQERDRALDDLAGRLRALSRSLSTEELPDLLWATYGSLVVTLHQLVEALDGPEPA